MNAGPWVYETTPNWFRVSAPGQPGLFCTKSQAEAIAVRDALNRVLRGVATGEEPGT